MGWKFEEFFGMGKSGPDTGQDLQRSVKFIDARIQGCREPVWKRQQQRGDTELRCKILGYKQAEWKCKTSARILQKVHSSGSGVGAELREKLTKFELAT